MNCRHCGSALHHRFLDLGFAPPSNAYVTEAGLSEPETTYPLRLQVCECCWLVQTEDYTRAGSLFDSDYAYFSSASRGWLAHAKAYAQTMRDSLQLDSGSFVVEVASNDGYLLRNFVNWKIPCLGVEPTASTASAAEALGIPVLREFFGADCAEAIVARNGHADLICGNNVYAHVPDVGDFTRGLKILLQERGTITLEFPHLLKLLAGSQFDTVYHEHFSYFSLHVVRAIFSAAGLRVFDVAELPTHGGSLRVFGCHRDDPREEGESVARIAAEEERFGLLEAKVYDDFQAKADGVKDAFLRFLLDRRSEGATVACYGAAAKGNTLLNYAGVKTDLISCVFDNAPSKQGKYMPGSHLPILAPNAIDREKPDYLVILPWNIAPEVVAQEGERVRAWGGKFVVAVPELKVLDA